MTSMLSLCLHPMPLWAFLRSGMVMQKRGFIIFAREKKTFVIIRFSAWLIMVFGPYQTCFIQFNQFPWIFINQYQFYLLSNSNSIFFLQFHFALIPSADRKGFFLRDFFSELEKLCIKTSKTISRRLFLQRIFFRVFFS